MAFQKKVAYRVWGIDGPDGIEESWTLVSNLRGSVKIPARCRWRREVIVDDHATRRRLEQCRGCQPLIHVTPIASRNLNFHSQP